MTDREKVIKGLEIYLKGNLRCKGCPYPNNGLCGDQLMADALALLKEQEAVEPKRIDGKRNHFIKCGNCNTDLMSGMKYCPECGKAVKWNDDSGMA